MRIFPSILLLTSALAVSCGQAEFFGHNDKEHGTGEQPTEAEAPDESNPGSTEDPATRPTPADPEPVVTTDDDEDPVPPPCVPDQTQAQAAQAQAAVQTPTQNSCEPQPAQEP